MGKPPREADHPPVSCAPSSSPSLRKDSPPAGEGPRGQGSGVAGAEEWGSGRGKGLGVGSGKGALEVPGGWGAARMGGTVRTLREAPDPCGERVGSRVSEGKWSRPPAPTRTPNSPWTPQPHKRRGDRLLRTRTKGTSRLICTFTNPEGPASPCPASTPEPPILGCNIS